MQLFKNFQLNLINTVKNSLIFLVNYIQYNIFYLLLKQTLKRADRNYLFSIL